MSVDKAKKINVKVTGPRPIHPTLLSIGFSVGALPAVRVAYAPGNTDASVGVINITSKDIFKQLKEDQESSFNTNMGDITLDVKSDDDPIGINFSGGINCPTYSFSVSNISTANNVLAKYAAMNAIDLSIYKIEVRYMLTDPIEGSDDPKLNKAILAIFNHIINSELEDIPEEAADVKKSVERLKAINDENAHYVQELFTNSTDMGWDKLNENLGQDAWDKCKARIINILQSNTGGFFNILLQLASEFQCIYVPDKDGKSPGKFINKDKIFNKIEDKTINAISINASMGFRGMYPPGAVSIVSPQPNIRYMTSTPDKNICVYPEGTEIPETATTLQIPGPPWLTDAVFESITPEAPEENTRDNNQSIGQNDANRAEAEQLVKDKEQVVIELLKQWAKSEYYWQSLGQTMCVISCEYTNLDVGKSYRVKNAKGEVLFVGLLYSISHNIDADVDKADATSVLNFSHVKVADAKIPGIENYD